MLYYIYYIFFHGKHCCVLRHWCVVIFKKNVSFVFKKENLKKKIWSACIKKKIVLKKLNFKIFLDIFTFNLGSFWLFITF